MSFRILIADDHARLRSHIRQLLASESDFEVVAEAGDGMETLSLIDALQPDLVLLDIFMPELDGFEVLAQLTRRKACVPVLVICVYQDTGLARAALHAGALGYLHKGALIPDLIGAVWKVMRGEWYVHPSMADLLR